MNNTACDVLKKGLTGYCCDRVSMPKDAARIMIDIAAETLRDPALLEIYNRFYSTHIASGYWTTVWETLAIDPYVEQVFGKHASLFYLHAALERVPLAEERYSQWGISETIFVDTLRDIGVWVQNTYNLTGHFGIRNFSWIWRHLEAKLFRLGRLQYIAQPFQGTVKAFYHENRNILLLLCDSGMELRANGDMQGVCGKEKTNDGFITKYEETEGFYVGNPVTPYGKGLREQVRLSKDEWQKVLDKGDYLLDIHIPRDQEFTMDAINESYQKAREFYALHFPELDIKGMICHTWLFTPQLQEMLPPSSNIVKFQRLFYLYPTKGSVDFLWNFVFNDLTEKKDAKPDTALRKKVLDYVHQDKEIFDMNGVFLDAAGGLDEPTPMDKYDQGTYEWCR